MTAIEKIESKLHNEIVLSAITQVRLELLQLTAKGEESCSLAKDPGDPGANWVSESGGLPPYICNVAKHIKEDGHTTSEAIAMAVSQIKKWIADPKTTPETKSKASAAIADWESKRGQAHVHSTVKSAMKKA